MTVIKYILTADDVEDNLTSTLGDVPLSANQGRILNTGKVDKNQGTAQAGKVLGIGADGMVYAMNAGTGAHASTHATGGSDPLTPAAIGACANNDYRLSDARTPTAHNHAASDINSGTLDAARLPVASTSAFGAVKVGSGLSVSGGVISVSCGEYAWKISNAPTGAYRNYSLMMPDIVVRAGEIPLSYEDISGKAYVWLFQHKVSGTFDIRFGMGYNTAVELFIRSIDSNGSVSVKRYTDRVIDESASNYYVIFKNITLSNCVGLDISVKWTRDEVVWSGLAVESVTGLYSATLQFD